MRPSDRLSELQFVMSENIIEALDSFSPLTEFVAEKMVDIWCSKSCKMSLECLATKFLQDLGGKYTFNLLKGLPKEYLHIKGILSSK